MASKIISETDYNRDDDKEKFGCQDRIIDICCLGYITCFSFDLGHKEDATMTLIFETEELLKRITQAMANPDK